MAFIFIAEDHEKSREIAKKHLARAQHPVLVEASNLATALSLVEQLPVLGIELAILDGNLTPGDDSGNDGKTIAEAIRKHCPGIKILVWSRQAYTWGDAYCPKGPDYNKLVEAVIALLESKPSDH